MTEDYPRHSYVMEREGLDKVCGYKVNNPDWSKCPHRREVRNRDAKIKDSNAGRQQASYYYKCMHIIYTT